MDRPFTDNGDFTKHYAYWYLTETLRAQGATADRTSIGTYADEYARVDGKWVFTSRDYHVLYNDEGKGDMSGVVNRLPG